MNYDGYFRQHVPSIIQMHGDGKSPSEIAHAIDDRPKIGYPLSSAMVRYILEREGYVVPVMKHLKYRTPRREKFIVEFNRAWAENNRDRYRDRLSAFQREASKLYILLGWIIEATGSEVDCDKREGNFDDARR